jgi:hypothetical protein
MVGNIRIGENGSSRKDSNCTLGNFILIPTEEFAFDLDNRSCGEKLTVLL